jgi:hypothetical protein
VFLASSWSGEMKIKDSTLKELHWFQKDEIPYDQMHEGNDEWLPKILEFM